MLKFLIHGFIFLSASLIFCVESKVYEKCELARELKDRHFIPYDQIGTFVCIAERQSNLNTQAVGHASYGIYHISSEFWCDEDFYSNKACGISCSSLNDDNLGDDIACVRTIFAEHQRIFNNGFQAWPSGMDCQLQGNRHIQECFTDQNEIIIATKKVPAATRLSTYEEGKVYERCELARELHDKHNIPMDQIATWVCIAKHESNYNTSAIGRLNWDGSEDHGIFQISDKYWCGESGKACGLTCEEVRDNDISNDVKCILQIHEEHTRLSGDGFKAWAVYPRCEGQSSSYIEGCFDNENEILPIQPKPGVQQPQKNYATPLRSRDDETSGVNEGKVYEKCELAQELRYKYNIPMEQVATWVCIAKHESNFNTSAIGRLNADGSEDHGMFQISDIFWCGESAGKACGLRCEELRDNDISNDVQCMQQIYDEHQRFAGNGFTAWAVYGPHCEGKSDTWIDGCFTTEFDFKPRPAVTQPTTVTTKKEIISSTTHRFDVKTISQDFDEPLIISTEEITSNSPITSTIRAQSTTKIPTTTKRSTTLVTAKTNKFIESTQRPFNLNRVPNNDFKKTSIKSSNLSTRSPSTINNVVESNKRRESSRPTTREFTTTKTTTTTVRRRSDFPASTAKPITTIKYSTAKINTSQTKRKTKAATVKPFNIFEFYLKDFTSRAPISYRPIQFSSRSTVIFKKSSSDIAKVNPNFTTSNRVQQAINISSTTPSSTTTSQKLSFFDTFDRLGDVSNNRIGRLAPNITPHSFRYLATLTTPRTPQYFG